MRLKSVAGIVLLAVAVCPSFGQATRPADLAQEIANGWMPDPTLTPGDSFPGMTGDIVTAPGYAKSVRAVTRSEKAKVYAEYGIASHAPGDYEIDHLIPLELGGSNDITNLWPEPYRGAWNAHTKDALEDRLSAMVKAHLIDLADAQKAIATDWIGAHEKYLTGGGGPAGR